MEGSMTITQLPAAPPRRPHVIVIGAGFGGLNAARGMAGLPMRVTLIDRHNYHLFTPLLYQVATAGLNPEQIAHPVRAILHGQKNVRFWVADVQRVDLKQRTVITNEGDLAYDYLILAAGSTSNFFGMHSVAAAAQGLKDVDEAMALRNHILACFEDATWEPDPARRQALLTFVIVGGGPTGVEFAGALRELVGNVLTKDYPALDFGVVRVVLLEAAGQLLSALHPKLQRAALAALQGKGVDVRLNTAVDRLNGHQVYLKGTGVKGNQTLAAATVMWAAGVRAGDLAGAIAVPHGKAGRVRVQPSLQLDEHPEVFVIGDMAASEGTGEPLAMVAPVAIQGAECAVRNIGHLIRGEAVEPFRYRDKGVMATIGRNQAVAQIGSLRVTGFIAWLMWLALHVVMLIGFRNRVLVMVDWIWNYLTFDRAVRLILGHPEIDHEPVAGKTIDRTAPNA